MNEIESRAGNFNFKGYRATTVDKPEEPRMVLRFRLIPALFAVCIAALFGWAMSLLVAAYNPAADKENLPVAFGIISGVAAAIFLLVISCSGNTRSTTVIKATGGTFLSVDVVANIVMAFTLTDMNWMIIANALWLLLYAAISYGVGKSGM